jgi:Na+-translocating ferredoxin:NAD+ oxidoreductase RnfA subunit
MGNARTHLGCKCVLGITQEFCGKLGMGVIAGYVINVGKILSFYLSLYLEGSPSAEVL